MSVPINGDNDNTDRDLEGLDDNEEEETQSIQNTSTSKAKNVKTSNGQSRRERNMAQNVAGPVRGQKRNVNVEDFTANISKKSKAATSKKGLRKYLSLVVLQ